MILAFFWKGSCMYKPLEKGFFHELEKIGEGEPECCMASATPLDIERVLAKKVLNEKDFLLFLSPVAGNYLEEIAQRANSETLRIFGRSVQLFTPLYLANYCTNRCLYCGFSARREIERKMLSRKEVEAEARVIAKTGLRKILALTGDAPLRTGAKYLASCLEVLSSHFSSVGIEVPSMTVAEYAMQVEAGADSMTMFQETYNPKRYAELHPQGPKRDFIFRLDAPERAVLGGMRAVNLGPLLGLDDWRRDVFIVGLHAAFLMEKYPGIEVSISLPRMRPHEESGEVKFQPRSVSDRDFVQALVSLRCFLPQAGITMSSREPAWLRDKLLPLGVTRVSAGVCTAVGGHAKEEKQRLEGRSEKPSPQFNISDERSVDEMAEDLYRMGYQPVFADWLLSGKSLDSLTEGVRSSLNFYENSLTS